jgi:hypothetical protein
MLIRSERPGELPVAKTRGRILCPALTQRNGCGGLQCTEGASPAVQVQVARHPLSTIQASRLN